MQRLRINGRWSYLHATRSGIEQRISCRASDQFATLVPPDRNSVPIVGLVIAISGAAIHAVSRASGDVARKIAGRWVNGFPRVFASG